MPTPPPHTPDVLHLLRLAQTVPDEAVTLPHSRARVLWLRQQQPLPHATSVLCLQGEVIIDFAGGGFVQLHSGELCALSSTANSALPVLKEALLLLLEE